MSINVYMYADMGSSTFTSICGKLVVDIILQVNRLMSCTDIISFFVQVANL